MKLKVLFVNHSTEQCGVYQFGKRVFELSSVSANVSYDYLETNSKDSFLQYKHRVKPDIIMYNWYPITMSWLTEDMVRTDTQHKHIFIFHDGNLRKTFNKYLFFGSEGKDVNLPKDKTAILPRPLFTYSGEYPSNSLPTIGSFGFGGWQKGFVNLIELVNNSFDNAVVNIQMPFAYFGDRHGTETLKIADACLKANKNPGIKLNIDHRFITNEETLKFLAGNDINVFMYNAVNQGLSSVIDYALSVKRPIGITNNSMFKHIYRDDICIDNKSLPELIRQGTTPLQNFYDEWNPSNFHSEMDKVLNAL